MNNITKEAADFSLKQENHHHHDKTKKEQASIITTSSSTSSNLLTAQWLRSKDPRIVRVSRAFGSKDRHSKVCTVRGLRDRRVRLSVSTAIQLYDLQDRLGFNQPSKVVDWLLENAKHEIDELPPLQIPPGISFTSFSHHHQQQQPSTMNNNHEVSKSQQNHEQGFNINPHHHHQASFLGLLNTMPLGYNANNDSSNLIGFGNQNQTDYSALSSTLSLSSGPYFASSSHFGAIQDHMDDDDDPRQMNQYHHHHHQMLMSSSSNSLLNPPVSQPNTKPFSLSMMMMNPKLLRSPNSSETLQCRNKDQVFPSK